MYSSGSYHIINPPLQDYSHKNKHEIRTCNVIMYGSLGFMVNEHHTLRVEPVFTVNHKSQTDMYMENNTPSYYSNKGEVENIW